MMRTFILTTAALALAAAAPVFAATNTTAAPGMTQTATPNSTTDLTSPTAGPMGAVIQQKINHELSQAGFTDIHVMPQSFLVRAKDSSGNPVMMVINPDSVTALTEMQGHPGSQSGSQSAQTGAMGSSTMNNSAHSGGAINSPNGNGTTVR